MSNLLEGDVEMNYRPVDRDRFVNRSDHDHSRMNMTQHGAARLLSRGSRVAFGIVLFTTALAMPSAAFASRTAGTSSGTAKATAKATVSCVSAAEKIIAADQASTPMKLGKVLNAKLVKGKSVWYINDTMASSTLAIEQGGFDSAAKLAGVKVTNFNANGTVTGIQQGFANAFAAHPAAIVIAAIEASLIEPQLARAKAAHIPVVSIWEGPVVKGTIYASVLDNSVQQGQSYTAASLIATSCNTHALWIYAPTYNSEVQAFQAGQALMTKLCPINCSIQTLYYDLASPAAVAAPAAEAVAGNTKINTVVLGTDDIADVVVPALTQANLSPAVYSGEGIPYTISSIRNGGIVKGDMALLGGSPATGWMAFDQVLRGILKMQPSHYDNIYGLYIDSSNVGQVKGGNPIPSIELYYKADFAKNWGLKK